MTKREKRPNQLERAFGEIVILRGVITAEEERDKAKIFAERYLKPDERKAYIQQWLELCVGYYSPNKRG